MIAPTEAQRQALAAVRAAKAELVAAQDAHTQLALQMTLASDRVQAAGGALAKAWEHLDDALEPQAPGAA